MFEPLHVDCSNFADARGLLCPEVTALATKVEAEEKVSRVHIGYYSNCRICELEMTGTTEKNHQSYEHLLDCDSHDEWPVVSSARPHFRWMDVKKIIRIISA